MNKELIKKHLLCTHKFQADLEKIVKPLFTQSMVQYFAYNRFYRDQKWIGIYSDPAPVTKTLELGQGPLFVDESGVFIDAGYYFHEDLREALKANVSSDSVDQFFSQEHNPAGKKVVQNGLLIIRKGQVYDESFYFSLLDTHLNSKAYYLHILKNLKRFSSYFIFKARKLIEEAEKNKIRYDLPPADCNFFDHMFAFSEGDQADKNWFNVNKFCLSTDFGDVFLSKQEINCLRYIAQGFTHNETAEKLSLTPKTVESYVANVKNKLSVNSRAELANFYNNFSVIDFS